MFLLLNFAVPKNIRLNCAHYLIMEIPNKLTFNKSFNHSSDIDFKEFMNQCKKCTAKPYSFLVIDATLASDDILHFRKDLLEGI